MLLTLVSVYLLILAGALVRVTGSGMGCPDWPKCYGQWVPPMDASQLKPGYQEHYAAKRLTKNTKLAKLLRCIGAETMATRIENDPAIYHELEFNAGKTWTEYVNRLLGMITGLFSVAMGIFSFSYRKTNKAVIGLSLLAVFIIGLEGWIGSLVVSTKLLENVVTIHMLLALVVVFILFQLVMKVNTPQTKLNPSVLFKRLTLLMLVMLGVEILLGSQVREAMERSGYDRSQAIFDNSSLFFWHRSFTWGLMILGIAMARMAYKLFPNTPPHKLAGLLLNTILVQVLTGIVMNYFDMPAAAQAIHLFVGSLSFGIASFIYLQFHKSYKTIAA